MTEFDPRETPWKINEKEYEACASPEERARFLTRYAVLAPSGHNTQPWKFGVTEEGVALYADYSRRLPVADSDDRELTMSLGAAIANLRVAAAHFGLSSDVKPEPEPGRKEMLALVTLREGGEVDRKMASLFPCITQRRTNRSKYEDKPLSAEDLARLEGFISYGSASLKIVTDDEWKNRIADLVLEGDFTRMSDKAFRSELADWMRPTGDARGDGLAADALGIPSPLSGLINWAMRAFNMGKSTGKKDAELVKESAAMVVALGEDETSSLLDAGQLFETFVLAAVPLSIQYSFFNLPVEVPETRAGLQDTIEAEKLPQLLFRLGYGRPPSRPAPRRPIRDVVV